MACPGESFLMSTSGSCSGHPFLKLYDPSSGTKLAIDYGVYEHEQDETWCSELIYTFPSSGICRPYEIREYCFGTNDCSGRVYFTRFPLKACAGVGWNDVAIINCPRDSIVSSIDFASYGTPSGYCGAFFKGWCDSSNSMREVRGACLNKESCTVSAVNSVFGEPCQGTLKHLKIQAACNLYSLPLRVCDDADWNTVATINCPKDTIVRSIDFASYGTATGSCGDFYKNPNCDSSNSMLVVSDACLNKATCRVSAVNSVFGEPCKGIVKRLKIQATCDRYSLPLRVCAKADYNNVAQINCPSGTFVRNIVFASYGTPGGTCGAFTISYYIGCHCSYSMRMVENACLNKETCRVAASTKNFGDPCRGTDKYLYIQATCGL